MNGNLSGGASGSSTSDDFSASGSATSGSPAVSGSTSGRAVSGSASGRAVSGTGAGGGFASCGASPTVAAPVIFGGQTNFNFHGMLDDVRIYNRALTASEVSALYQGTACP